MRLYFITASSFEKTHASLVATAFTGAGRTSRRQGAAGEWFVTSRAISVTLWTILVPAHAPRDTSIPTTAIQLDSIPFFIRRLLCPANPLVVKIHF
ncbi:hypothetical protein J6590_044600 [Homalodisca vitripennis]|nr:hypothetical protein J6590_044600 [Homalodisca vitripennis]